MKKQKSVNTKYYSPTEYSINTLSGVELYLVIKKVKIGGDI
ncbi:hypothetical protein RJI07_03020 [Mycoplasmatota bacterium WC30]